MAAAASHIATYIVLSDSYSHACMRDNDIIYMHTVNISAFSYLKLSQASFQFVKPLVTCVSSRLRLKPGAYYSAERNT